MAEQSLARGGNPRDLIRYLDGFTLESDSRIWETSLADADLNARFLRGDQYPSVTPLRGEQYHFVMNMIYPSLLRHVALLTDTKPKIDVLAGRKGRRKSADVYKNTIEALWDESHFE